MDNVWVNEFIYTKNIVAEGQRGVLKTRNKIFYAILVLIALLFLFGAYIGAISYVWLIYPLVLLVISKVIIHTSIKREWERLELLSKDKTLKTRIEIRDDNDINFERENTQQKVRLSFSDLKKIKTTKNLIILWFKGNLMVYLHKQGFIEGDAKTCLAYLKEKKKSR